MVFEGGGGGERVLDTESLILALEVGIFDTSIPTAPLPHHCDNSSNEN